MRKIEIFDTTLRDGAQARGISFSVEDKLAITEVLDDMGIAFIEAGNPGSNPKDLEFFEKVSRARTFAFDYEIDFLKKNNLALGGSLDNAVVIGENGPLNKEGLRFENEFVRHKILDIIGDLYVLGKPLKAHIIAIKAGHLVNSEIAKLIGEKYLK